MHTTINRKQYTLKPIAPGFLAKFRTTVHRRVSCYEIDPSARSELIKSIIGPYAVRMLGYRARFFKIDYLADRIKALKRFYIKDMKETVGSIFDKLQAEGLKLFLHGGIIRDMIKGVRSSDIDILFDRDVSSVKALCDKLNWPCSTVLIREQYINFGTDKGASIEGGNLSKAFMTPVWEQENSINSFAYDLQNDILIDITGFGLVDIIHNKFRLGVKPADWPKWARSDAKRPFRYFKMLEKGYEPLNPDMHKFVVDYIENNWETIYNRPIHKDYPIPWIKQILVKTITQGEIDPITGSYSFGPTISKLMPFLISVKKHVSPELFFKIMAIFTPEDIKQFYEARVITNDNKYIKYRDLLKLASNPKTAKTKKPAKKVVNTVIANNIAITGTAKSQLGDFRSSIGVYDKSAPHGTNKSQLGDFRSSIGVYDKSAPHGTVAKTKKAKPANGKATKKARSKPSK
jgi:hypothetical protein